MEENTRFNSAHLHDYVFLCGALIDNRLGEVFCSDYTFNARCCGDLSFRLHNNIREKSSYFVTYSFERNDFNSSKLLKNFEVHPNTQPGMSDNGKVVTK